MRFASAAHSGSGALLIALPAAMSSEIHLATIRPTGGLPRFERAELPAVAPAHGEIDVARAFGDVGQKERRVMKQIAMDGPQKLRLRIAARAQFGELFGGRLQFQYRGNFVADFSCLRHVVGFRGIENENVLADLAEKSCARFLTERAFVDQRLQDRGRLEVVVPRVFRKRVVHRLDDVAHRVEADDIGGAIRRTFRMADCRTGECIDHVETEFVLLGVIHRRQH